MANVDHRGEFSKFYYQIGDYDTTQSDATILADSNWIEMCIIDLSATDTHATNEINDRCSPTFKVFTAGKRDFSLAVNINEIRHDEADVQAWYDNLDSADIFAILALNDARTETTAYGIVGNFLPSDANYTQPQEGDNAEAITFKPAARSDYQSPIVRRIYGSGIPAAS
jgi:hypothetical protein